MLELLYAVLVKVVPVLSWGTVAVMVRVTLSPLARVIAGQVTVFVWGLKVPGKSWLVLT